MRLPHLLSSSKPCHYLVKCIIKTLISITMSISIRSLPLYHAIAFDVFFKFKENLIVNLKRSGLQFLCKSLTRRSHGLPLVGKCKYCCYCSCCFYQTKYILFKWGLLSCQPRVTVKSCFVYKVITDLASIDH